MEGLEVVLINEKKDPTIYKTGVNNTDKSAVHIYAHGTPSNIDVTGDGNWSPKPEDFKTVLQKSDVYTTRKQGEKTIVVLHSCRAGRSFTDEKGNYNPSYAEKMSSQNPDLIIIAPDERDVVNSKYEELGPHKIDNPQNARGDYKAGAKHTTNDERGNWNVFEGGKLTGSYSGENYNGQKAPSWFERTFLFKKNTNNNNNQQTSSAGSNNKKEVTKEKEKEVN